MIGSISKVRPCGNHHYYKYAHAKTAQRGANKQYIAKNDLFYVSNDYIHFADEFGLDMKRWKAVVTSGQPSTNFLRVFPD